MRWYTTGDVRAEDPLVRRIQGAAAQFEAYANRAGTVPANRPDLGPCWTWTGCMRNGYGLMSSSGRSTLAHTWSYEHFVAPIAPGLEPDHLCRNTSCVNPSHLEPVTHRENTLRGESPPAKFARRTACSKGHEFTQENTFTRPDKSRGCRTCDRARSRAAYQKRRARRA